MEAREPITIEAFETWLEQFEPTMQIGVPNSQNSCPLWKFIDTLSLYNSEFTLGIDAIYFSARSLDYGKIRWLPDWCISFVDRLRLVTNRGYMVATVEQCLTVVQEIKELLNV